MRGIFSAISVAVGLIVLSLATSASAATVTYRSGEVLTPTFFQPDSSTIVVPSGRTPVAKVELPGVITSSDPNPAGLDADLALTGPAGTAPPFDLLSDACTFYASNSPINFTDTATSTVGAGNCGGDLKPEDARTLALFNGGASGGPWTITLADDENDGDSVSISTWNLRITHAPFEFTVKANKQPLRKKVKLSATCNAKCTISSSGNVKSRKLVQAQGVNVKFKLPLKASAFERLEAEGGKAKFTLVASDGYGDTSTLKVKIRFP